MKGWLYPLVLFSILFVPFSYGKEECNHPIIEQWSTTNSPVVLIKLVDILGENRNMAEAGATIYIGVVESSAGCSFSENTVIIYVSPAKIDIENNPRIIMGGNPQIMLKPIQGNESARFFIAAEGGYTVKASVLINYSGTLSSNLLHIKSFLQFQI